MKLTALIPAHNDDYTLPFCLDSIVDVFDEIIVLDDCSDDGTADLLMAYTGEYKNVKAIIYRHDQQLGWWRAREELLTETDNDYLFFLDSDDVLAEYNASLLQRIAEAGPAVVCLRLFELWGDFDHGTGHRTKTDACHVFIDRSRCSATWGPSKKYGGTSAGLQTDWGRTVHHGGVLFFHIKGVKPDRRLYERQQIRPWIREGMPGRLSEWAHLDTVSPNMMHERTLTMLLKSRQDHIKKLYPGGDVPQRPKVIREAPKRFEIVYKDGKPVDRIDKGEGSTCERSH